MNANSSEVAIFKPARLPWHDAIEERFGEMQVTKASWKVLTEATWPSAKTVDAIVMALAYCKSRKLDPFKKPVHIVPVWDSKANDGKGGWVETVWPSISEMRTTAFRTKQYAGCDETEFGPLITTKFTGKVKQNGGWVDRTIELTFPEWARITVYRTQHGAKGKFVGPKVKWTETYATLGKSDLPNLMWEERPEGQLEKCAEAAALRKAFPEELGSEYAAEEMEGQRIISADDEPTIPQRLEAPAPKQEPAADGKPQAVKGTAPMRAPPPPAAKDPRSVVAPTSKADDARKVRAEAQDAEIVDDPGEEISDAVETGATNWSDECAEILAALEDCKSEVAVVSFQTRNLPKIIDLSSEEREHLIAEIQKARARFQTA